MKISEVEKGDVFSLKKDFAVCIGKTKRTLTFKKRFSVVKMSYSKNDSEFLISKI